MDILVFVFTDDSDRRTVTAYEVFNIYTANGNVFNIFKINRCTVAEFKGDLVHVKAFADRNSQKERHVTPVSRHNSRITCNRKLFTVIICADGYTVIVFNDIRHIPGRANAAEYELRGFNIGKLEVTRHLIYARCENTILNDTKFGVARVRSIYTVIGL